MKNAADQKVRGDVRFDSTKCVEWLPYAGMNQIRFDGLIPKDLSAPPRTPADCVLVLVCLRIWRTGELRPEVRIHAPGMRVEGKANSTVNVRGWSCSPSVNVAPGAGW